MGIQTRTYIDDEQRMGIVEKYPLAEHVMYGTPHNFEFDKTKVIANITNYYS